MKYNYKYAIKAHYPNWFWGIVLILSACLLILSKLNVFTVHLGIMQIGFTIIFALILIRSLVRLRIPGIVFSIAFLAIIYAKPLGISQLSPWTILISAVLINWGLALFFKPYPQLFSHFIDFTYDEKDHHKHHKRRHNDTFDGDFEEINQHTAHHDEHDNESFIKIDNNLGSATKHIDTENFKYADVTSSMGEINLYLNHAEIQGEKAEINFNVSMSDVDIYVPTDWKVIDQVEHFMDDFDIKSDQDENANKTVYLTGKVSFSDLTVYHI